MEAKDTVKTNEQHQHEKSNSPASSHSQQNNDNTAQSISCSTKVRRKTLDPRIPAKPLLWLLLSLSLLAQRTMADCPSVCECKWKSGKESVQCLNANLTHIPEPLDQGTQVLDLTGNDIQSIPHDTFAAAQLLNLQKIYLAKCRLRVIEQFAFRKLINLVELDLSYNQLTSIPEQAFEAIGQLRDLKLNGNPITRVQDQAFINVPQLVRLELSDCRLSVVEVRAFAGLESSLEWLKLDGNRLSEVRAGTITSLSSLHGIELARNVWNCSCALRPLRVWMVEQNIPCGIPPICRAPARLANKPWDKIELDEFACVPQIIATDTTAHGVEGRNVTMSCFVEGVPEPSVRWLVKNRVIANLTSSESGGGPRTAAATQGRKTYVVNMLRNASNLTILTADMQDAGIYTCAAENKAGKVEASVTLAVSRRPPDAPLGLKIVLLCIVTALLFVVGSSFAAICVCSLRRKRKMRLWNTVPAARTDSYEKIEMTARGGRRDGAGGDKPDLGGGNGYLHATGNGGGGLATTPDDGSDIGVAVVNPSGAGSGATKRNGDYLNIPTHCDDDDDAQQQQQQSLLAMRQRQAALAGSKQQSAQAQQQQGNWHKSPQELNKRKLSGFEDNDLHIPRLIDLGSESASSSISSQVDAAARLAGKNTSTYSTIATTKINSPHSQLHDFAQMQKLKQSSSAAHTASTAAAAAAALYYNNNDSSINKSLYSKSDDALEPTPAELFDSNYPDLLDIAKYAVAAQAKSQTLGGNNAAAAITTTTNGGICSTLPRKLKHTGKYFKNSTDSQSPLLAVDGSSKYSSGQLGEMAFANESMTALGRRYSAESTYSNYAATGPTYTSGQRANSFMNLVQSGAHKGATTTNNSTAMSQSMSAASAASVAMSVAAQMQRRNPSLPGSPVHENLQQQLQQKQQALQLALQQHQRSLSTAATPLLDFSSLASRTTGMPLTSLAAATPIVSGATTTASAVASTSAPATTTSSTPVTAYDYHAAQLERFLEEYRSLQDQLCKMKETCETIRKKDAPLRVGVGHAAASADPVMFNAAMATPSPTANPRTATLKTKTLLPGQPPDPPPYWLHRNALLKRLNEQQNDIFKS